MDRIHKIAKHLQQDASTSSSPSQDAKPVSQCPFASSFSSSSSIQSSSVASAPGVPVELMPPPPKDVLDRAVDPPVVEETSQLSEDPFNFLLDNKRKYPDLFMVKRSAGNQYIVISDVEMFEDILTFDGTFGNPVTPNMSVNKNIFQIPVDQLERHEQKAIGGLRQFILANNDKLADKIAANLIDYMQKVLGDSGVIDLRELGTAVFWPMTQTLFGDGASMEKAPYLRQAFEDIDNLFGAALKGKKIPKVQEAVNKAYTNFSQMLQESKKTGGCPVGPIMQYYDDATNHEDPNLTAKFSTAAWWGGQGNTLPSTVWSFGMILRDPRTKKIAYDEVDNAFKDQPNKNGEYDYGKLEYLTAALKETLRMYTYSIAWRLVQHDCVVTSPKTGKSYKLKKGTLIGLHFCMRHQDPDVHPNPKEFRPERFLGTGAGLSPTINGHQYAYVPFSAGRHKCAGYGLAMLEIPVVMALVFRHYDMALLDPLPGLDFKQAFGVIGPTEQPVRVQYKRRR